MTESSKLVTAGGHEHEAVEAYTCSDAYKCCAVRYKGIALYALFKPEVPTFAMPGLTREIHASMAIPWSDLDWQC